MYPLSGALACWISGFFLNAYLYSIGAYKDVPKGLRGVFTNNTYG
jgi:hypothetical protein